MEQCISCGAGFEKTTGSIVGNYCRICNNKLQESLQEPQYHSDGTDINWEDPECELIAAVRQIQELLNDLVSRGKILPN